jgi:hypothetical protein
MHFLQAEAESLRKEALAAGRGLSASAARQRALEQVCRVIFNLNEFVYAD